MTGVCSSSRTAVNRHPPPEMRPAPHPKFGPHDGWCGLVRGIDPVGACPDYKLRLTALL